MPWTSGKTTRTLQTMDTEYITEALNLMKQYFGIDLSGDKDHQGRQIKAEVIVILEDDEREAKRNLETNTAEFEAAKVTAEAAYVSAETTEAHAARVEALAVSAAADTTELGRIPSAPRALATLEQRKLVVANAAVANADAALVAVNEKLITIRLSLDVIKHGTFDIITYFRLNPRAYPDAGNPEEEQENPLDMTTRLLGPGRRKKGPPRGGLRPRPSDDGNRRFKLAF